MNSVAIIGAGFAGLACAARLKSNGLDDFVLYEAGQGVGGFWRGNYDRIRLHTPFHDLPEDGGLRSNYGQFLARDQLIEYFESYAQHHSLANHIRVQSLVSEIDRDEEGWSFLVNGKKAAAERLVVATAYNRIPLVPSFEGQELFSGNLVHSRAYQNAGPFQDARVLIIGGGNSAAEIALDLCEGGAKSVTMTIRGPRHVIALKKLALFARIARFLRIEMTAKHVAAAHAYSRTHPDFLSKLAEKDKFFLSCSIDLSRYGLEVPAVGPATQIALHGKVPWMDQGTVAAIRKGHIEVVDLKKDPLLKFTEPGVEFASGPREFDAVILATGMEPGLDKMFVHADRYLYFNEDMQRLMPNTNGRSHSVVDDSLYFPGLDLSSTGGLSLGLWGFEVADLINGAMH